MKKVFLLLIMLLCLTSCKSENFSDEVYFFDVLKYDSFKYTKEIENGDNRIYNYIEYSKDRIHYYEERNNTIVFDAYVKIEEDASFFIYNETSNIFNNAHKADDKWYMIELKVQPVIGGFRDNGAWYSPSVSGTEVYLKYVLFDYLINNPFGSISDNLSALDFVVGIENYKDYDLSKTLLENFEEKNQDKLKFTHKNNGLYQNDIYKVTSRYDSTTGEIIVEETDEVEANRNLTIKNSLIKKYEINNEASSVSVSVSKKTSNIKLPEVITKI